MKPAFGEWLDAQRLNRGWSISEFSRRSGVSKTTLSHYISGVLTGESAQLKTLKALATALELPAHVLIYHTGFDLELDTPYVSRQQEGSTVFIETVRQALSELSPEDQRKVITALFQ